MSKEQALLKEYIMGDIKLRNRVVMAPMTRSRANNTENAPTDLMAKYYEQRASAGLIITEGSQISKRAVGYINTPGIYSTAQVEGWQIVTDNCQFFCYRQVQYLQVLFASYEKRPMLVFME